MFQINSGRQHKTAGEQRIRFSDLVSGVPLKALWLPGGAYNISLKVIPLTAFNSGTSDVLDVGTVDTGNAYSNDANIHATTPVVAAALPNIVPNGQWVYVTWTGVGAVPSAGEVLLAVEYALIDASQFDHGENR